ncbi:hypothetical protein [Noviherbaspirillum denitrificans]|uniref:Uncharacterized protein n=1 Tax=Noviherbaspirillum denitrificans TaxID=1968433 RepID=A0A254THN3_9BURK|nr:hypothetical protein [Noviherbaspirillum denitrificans]OWW22025.1 hypothetical protein AYR66_23575 [Noviherbaspirillum denitrificans]
MKKLFLLIPAVVVFAACSGGGDGDVGGTASSGSSQTPSAPQADRFTGDVSAVLGSSSETTEPAALDASPASKPEDTEPMPVS